jgi:hypothetical protein
VGFELTIPAFKRAKTALDREATLIDEHYKWCTENFMKFNFYYTDFARQVKVIPQYHYAGMSIPLDNVRAI